MRILLIYPYCLEERLHTEDAGVVPIGVYAIASVLKTSHYDVEILNWHDIHKTPEKIPMILEEKRPDVIGLSILHANRWGGIEIAGIAKRINPSVSVVFGGIGATNLWRHFLTHFADIDVVVLGEGEFTFLELVQRWEERTEISLRDIRGIAYREDGRPVRTDARAPIDELDTLPNPARYFGYRHVALTRGCPGRCTFCGSPRYWGGRVRFHSADYFVDQLEMLYRKGVTFFYISDDTFTLRKDLVMDICRQILDRRLPIAWAAISRVDTIDEEIVHWMRKAGCIQISYGVESGSENNRRLLNKPYTEARIEAAFKLTARYGIMARAYFIYGCPGESWETIQESLDLMDVIAPLGAIFYILDIFPGTALYEDYLVRSGNTDDVWLNRIEDIPYFETDPDMTRDNIFEFGEKLRAHFYRNLPRYVDTLQLVDNKEMYPLHADFYSRLAMTFDHGDYAQIAEIPDKEDTAEQLYKKALSYHPDARAFLGLGIRVQRRREYDMSVEILSKGVWHFPDNEQLNICLAVNYMNMGAFETALSYLLKFQHSRDALPFVVGCYQALDEPKKAAEFMDRLTLT